MLQTPIHEQQLPNCNVKLRWQGSSRQNQVQVGGLGPQVLISHRQSYGQAPPMLLALVALFFCLVMVNLQSPMLVALCLKMLIESNLK